MLWCQAMTSLAGVDPDAVWFVLARTAWEGGCLEAPQRQAPPGLPPWSQLFPEPQQAMQPRPSMTSAQQRGTALVAASLLEKVEPIMPPWLAQAAEETAQAGCEGRHRAQNGR